MGPQQGPGNAPGQQPGQQPGQPQGQAALPPRRYGRIVQRNQQRFRPVRQRRRPYSWQLPNERIIWIRRRHWIYLLAPAWPLALTLAALGLLHLLGGSLAAVSALLQLLTVGLILVLLVRWAIVDLGDWIFRYYILTDQRVIASHGYFRPDRREAVLKSVVQVLVQRPNALLVSLNIGDVIVRVIGTSVDLTGVSHPRDVGDSILQVQENPSGAAAPAPAAPHVPSQKIQTALDTLAVPVALPAAPQPGRPPFFGLLQRKVPVRLFEGESAVEIVYRHWFILVRRLVPALLLFVAGVAGGIALSRYQGAQAGMTPMYLVTGGIVVGLGWAGLIYLNFVDDIFVLTTHRVIDIDRLIFILSEYSNDAPFVRVQDIHVEVGLLGNALGYGTIVVETSGRKYPLKMTDVPHPLQLMDRIFGLINDVKERESAIAINKQKKENYKWLATVLHEMLIIVPDVRGLSLLEAGGRLRQLELKFTVQEERFSPGLRSGTVRDQIPSPGSTALPENEVRLVLSTQSAPVATP